MVSSVKRVGVAGLVLVVAHVDGHAVGLNLVLSKSYVTPDLVWIWPLVDSMSKDDASVPVNQ